MDFGSKTSKLCGQEAVDKSLASFGFLWNLGIKIEFFPNDVDVISAPPDKKGVYMHPLVLVLGLRLPMMKFVHSILIFYGATPSQLSAVAWRIAVSYTHLTLPTIYSV